MGVKEIRDIQKRVTGNLTNIDMYVKHIHHAMGEIDAELDRLSKSDKPTPQSTVNTQIGKIIDVIDAKVKNKEDVSILLSSVYEQLCQLRT